MNTDELPSAVCDYEVPDVASLNRVRTVAGLSFADHVPSRAYPCQRLVSTLVDNDA